MKIPIWIKSEYVTYIGIALLSFVRRGKPLLLWRAGRLLCILLSHKFIIYCKHLFVNIFLSYYVHQRLDRPPQ